MLDFPSGVVEMFADLREAKVLITPTQQDGEDLKKVEKGCEGKERM